MSPYSQSTVLSSNMYSMRSGKNFRLVTTKGRRFKIKKWVAVKDRTFILETRPRRLLYLFACRFILPLQLKVESKKYWGRAPPPPTPEIRR